MPRVSGRDSTVARGDMALREIVQTFESALGPFGDPGVMAVVREFPETLPEPGLVRVLIQCHARVGVRTRPVLLTVLNDTLALSTNAGPLHEWPLRECVIRREEGRLAGLRITITTPAGDAVTLSRAMPIDEVPRLMAAASPGDADRAFSAHPPVARLGAAATLYDDRIAFAGAPTRSLAGGVRARALEISSAGTALRSVSRLMRGAHGRPRHVLVDGPDWSQMAPAPETGPELADAFADAVNRWAAG